MDPRALKPYHVLECADLSVIQEKVITYLNEKTDLLANLDQGHELWHKVSASEIIKACPELYKYFAGLGLKLREVALTLVSKPQDVNLHIDELPTVAKINVPILNTANTVNQWYRVPDAVLTQVGLTTNHFGNQYCNLAAVDIAECELIDEVTTSTPIVFNSQIPHKVQVLAGAQFPRIVMPCMFFNQPIKYLEV